jgi:glycosidase
MDHVSNHIGIYHPWIINLPDSTWINGSVENHLSNHHKKEMLQDIHRDSLWLNRLQTGWFDDVMPDLNQKNPHVATYLIQNTIWWIEFSGIDGIREDTYPYADQNYLAKWAASIFAEYPNFNIVGEVWIHDPVFIAPYQQKSCLTDGPDSYLPVVTDFGLLEAFGRIFNRQQSIYQLYYFLCKDFLYSQPDQLLIFLDNHDVMRAFDLVDGDMRRLQQALKILLSIRGIPQIYYGTEIALSGKESHEAIRATFPGGFASDERNAFMEKGRSEQENRLWSFLRDLLKIRKENSAFASGSLMHIPPEDEFYVYFRQNEEQKLMMIVNNHNEQRYFSIKTLGQHIKKGDVLLDLQNGKGVKIVSESELPVPAYDVAMYQILPDGS